jgi:hypothetical protein
VGAEAWCCSWAKGRQGEETKQRCRQSTGCAAAEAVPWCSRGGTGPAALYRRVAPRAMVPTIRCTGSNGAQPESILMSIVQKGKRVQSQCAAQGSSSRDSRGGRPHRAASGGASPLSARNTDCRSRQRLQHKHRGTTRSMQQEGGDRGVWQAQRQAGRQDCGAVRCARSICCASDREAIYHPAPTCTPIRSCPCTFAPPAPPATLTALQPRRHWSAPNLSERLVCGKVASSRAEHSIG